MFEHFEPSNVPNFSSDSCFLKQLLKWVPHLSRTEVLVKYKVKLILWGKVFTWRFEAI